MTTAAYDDAVEGLQSGITPPPENVFLAPKESSAEPSRFPDIGSEQGGGAESDSEEEDFSTKEIVDDVQWDPASEAVQHESEPWHGDRVLANTILFMRDAGMYIEFCSAVREGDMGRVFEIMKVRAYIVASRRVNHPSARSFASTSGVRERLIMETRCWR